MSMSHGTLLILDKGCTATTRIWVCYEMFVSLEDPLDLFLPVLSLMGMSA